MERRGFLQVLAGAIGAAVLNRYAVADLPAAAARAGSTIYLPATGDRPVRPVGRVMNLQLHREAVPIASRDGTWEAYRAGPLSWTGELYLPGRLTPAQARELRGWLTGRAPLLIDTTFMGARFQGEAYAVAWDSRQRLVRFQGAGPLTRTLLT